MRTGVYPGTFNPPTVAHLAIARAAYEQRSLDRLDLVVSLRPIGKEDIERPTFTQRIEVIEASIAHLDWLTLRTTEARLIADIAADYDVVVMGADKWAQVNDTVYYEDNPELRDAAVARLPELALVPRPPVSVPEEWLLAVDPKLAAVSSTGAREGLLAWMTPAARAFHGETGAWEAGG